MRAGYLSIALALLMLFQMVQWDPGQPDEEPTVPDARDDAVASGPAIPGSSGGTRVTYLLNDNFERSAISPWYKSGGTGYTGISTTTYSSSYRSMAVYANTCYVNSAIMDTSGGSDLTVGYWIREGSDGWSGSNEPESGEDLHLQYYTSSSTWSTIASNYGSTVGGTDITSGAVVLSNANAYHSNFRLRAYLTLGSGSGFDYFYLDNIYVYITVTPYAVDLAPASINDWTIPSVPIDYIFSAENLGSQDDTYNITGNGDYSIKFRDYADTKDITTIAVDSGETEYFRARVTIPVSTPNWDVGTNNITVESQNGTNVDDTSTVYTTNAGDLVRVGVYDHISTADISYFSGGNSNTYMSYYNSLMLDPLERFFPIVVSALSPATLSWLDALILPDNAVPDADLTNVDSWFTTFRGILAVDSAACFATYSGYLFPTGQGTNGRDVYWDYGSGLGDQKIVTAHRITQGYTVGNTYNSNSNTAQYFQSGFKGGTFPLTAKYSDTSDVYVAARSVPGMGRIVGLGPYGSIPAGMDDLVYNSILWTLSPPLLRQSGASRAPATVTQSDAAVTMANITIQGWNEAFNVSSISVNLTGTGGDSDVAAAFLARDTDGTGNYTASDVILEYGTFSGGRLRFESNLTIPEDEAHTYVVCYNISDDAQPAATVGARITSEDVARESYVVLLGGKTVQSMNATIAERVDRLMVTPRSLAPPSVEQGLTDVGMMELEVEALRQEVTLNSLGVELGGTGAPSDVTLVRLWLDEDDDGEFDPENDLELDRGALTLDTITLTGLGLELVEGEPVTLFASIDVSDTASLGETVALGAGSDAMSVLAPDKVVPFGPYMSNPSLIVDSIAPDEPLDLTITEVTHESITLEWEDNDEVDLEGYNLYRSLDPSPYYWGSPINGDELIVGTEYEDTGLDELTRYYYVVAAVDEVPNESEYSDDAFDTTLLGPHPPELGDVPDELEMKEDSVDRSINVRQWFTDVNNDPLDLGYQGSEHVEVSLDPNTGTVTLEPEADWSGEEVITFWAEDQTARTSHNLTVKVTPENDAPGPAKITSPDDGEELDWGETVTFTGECPDADEPYGEILTFTWTSDIDGELGTGETLEDVRLSGGAHEITLTVTDLELASAEAELTIIALPDPDKDSDGDGIPDWWEEEKGLDPGDPDDADSDPDGDGKTFLDDFNDEYPDSGGGGGTGTDGGGGDGGGGSTNGTGDSSLESVDDDSTILYMLIMLIIVIVVVLVIMAVVLRNRKAKEEGERRRAAAMRAGMTHRPQRAPPAVIDLQSPGGAPGGPHGMAPGGRPGGPRGMAPGGAPGGPRGIGMAPAVAAGAGATRAPGHRLPPTREEPNPFMDDDAPPGGASVAGTDRMLPAPKEDYEEEGPSKKEDDGLKSWSLSGGRVGEVPEAEGGETKGGGSRSRMVPPKGGGRRRRMEPLKGGAKRPRPPSRKEGGRQSQEKKDKGANIDVKLPGDYGGDLDDDEDIFDL